MTLTQNKQEESQKLYKGKHRICIKVNSNLQQFRFERYKLINANLHNFVTKYLDEKDVSQAISNPLLREINKSGMDYDQPMLSGKLSKSILSNIFRL